MEVFQLSAEPMNIFHAEYDSHNPPIRLSYVGAVHYDSIVDPSLPSVGIGLGMPGLVAQPISEQIVSAVQRESENELLDTAIEQQIISASENEQLEREMSAAALAISLRQYYAEHPEALAFGF